LALETFSVVEMTFKGHSRSSAVIQIGKRHICISVP